MAYVSKDDKIIEANPGKTPHEYRLLGVSEKKVKELEKKEVDVITKPQQKVMPEVETKQKVKPEIQKSTVHRATGFIKQPSQPRADTVLVIEKSTGHPTSMSRHHAERFVNKNKKTHHIG